MKKVIFVIIGTLIGAGFASGKEIYLFFLKYGVYGKIGIILSAIITGAIIFKVLYITKENYISNYEQLLVQINPKYNVINKILNIIVNTFLLISFYIMIAGFSAYINQTYGIKPYISSLVFVTIVYLIFNKNINGVIKINEILVPILIFFILYLGIKNIPFIAEKNISSETYENTKGWFISAILYTSYNSIILIPVLTSLKDFVKNKKSIVVISIVCSLITMLLAFSIYSLLLRECGEIFELEMPLIEITSEFGTTFKYMYGFVIATAIFTSVISTGYSFLKNVSTSKKNYNNISIIMCITGIAISNIGFSNLVKVLYPLFGVLGLIQIYFIISK